VSDQPNGPVGYHTKAAEHALIELLEAWAARRGKRLHWHPTKHV
jgi:hypothetical protein